MADDVVARIPGPTRAAVGVMRNFVLIVDDDDDIRSTLSQWFVRAGYSTKTAPNGLEAIELFEAGDVPRMVLVDLRMPGIIGNSVLEYMRNEPDLAAIPVAIVTASPELAPPGYPVFRKPIDLGGLLGFAATCESDAAVRP